MHTITQKGHGYAPAIADVDDMFHAVGTIDPETGQPTSASSGRSWTSVFAEAMAEEVVVPVEWRCCAYAGDRGMLHPELTASATRREAAEVGEHGFDAYASLNRTCELGMTEATGRPYRHVLQHLEAATR